MALRKGGYLKFRRNFFLFLGLTPIVMAFDSPVLAEIFPYGQGIASLMTFTYFLLTFQKAPPRLKKIMLAGLLVGLAGEVLFSLKIHMYEYRLENIPLYVPPGHAILYAKIYTFIREPLIAKNKIKISQSVYLAAALFSFSWLIFNHDLYGFICFGFFSLLIFLNPDSRLFFLGMYLLVAYLELIGTSLGCWFWHPVLLDRFHNIPSGNPPSSISVFYMGFDILCLAIYFLINPPLLKRYLAFRSSKATSLRNKKPQNLPES